MLYLPAFTQYHPDEEKEGGEYRKILEMPDDQIDGMYYSELSNIIPSIKDASLKTALKEKVYNKLLNGGIILFPYSDYLNTDLFTTEEKKNLLLTEIKTFNNQITENTTNNNFSISSGVESICSLLSSFDEEFASSYINVIFTCINNCENIEKKELLNYTILRRMSRVLPSVYKSVLADFKYQLPETFLKKIEIDQSPNYTKDNEKLFENEKIGIDKNISIGLEVEVNNEINNDFTFATQTGYELYSKDLDATVPRGLEFKPPVFHDGDEVKKIASFFKTIKDLGFHYDENQNNCGGQINLGLDYLDTKESVLNFYQIYCNCEELLFYISNKEGQLSRQGIYRNSRFCPISELIGKRVIRDTATREELLYELFAEYYTSKLGLLYKKNTVCVRDLNSEKEARLEFRIPNGSADFEVWKDNIRLYGKIMEAAKTIENISKKDYLSEREEEQMDSFASLLYDVPLEEKQYHLMNLLFEDENLKDIYNRRYHATVREIERTGTTLYDYKPEREVYSDPAFSSVEFFTGDTEDVLSAYYDPGTKRIRNVDIDADAFQEYEDIPSHKSK